MRIRHPWLATVLMAAFVVGCTAGGADGSASEDVIVVRMTDDLRFDPPAFTVRAGETVRFEVTNAGATAHEFLIGDEAAQAEYEAEMADGHGEGHDSGAGVSVDPGETESFEYTFTVAGELLAGCHEPGHYAGGMRATITVES